MPASDGEEVLQRLLAAAAPGVGDLGELHVTEALAGTGDLASPGVAIELAGIVVLGERPDDDAVEAEPGQLAPRGEEQPRAEADALILGQEIDLVDLALLDEVAGAVRPERRIAADRATDLLL